MSVLATPANTPAAWSQRANAELEPWAACGWSRDGQLERHLAIISVLAPEPGDRLLDFGCGTGALTELVDGAVDYIGYDWSPAMVLRAAREHPGRFFQGWHPTGVFDLVACVGVFNLAHNWSKQRTGHTIRHLWDTTACRMIAVSLYCGDDEECLSYTGAEAAEFGAQLGVHTTVDQIRHNDLLLTVRR